MEPKRNVQQMDMNQLYEAEPVRRKGIELNEAEPVRREDMITDARDVFGRTYSEAIAISTD